MFDMMVSRDGGGGGLGSMLDCSNFLRQKMELFTRLALALGVNKGIHTRVVSGGGRGNAHVCIPKHGGGGGMCA